ncbi:MAG: tRNA dihydrouridine synthase DusB [Deltaproteobacteria bacterium]|nr:tRNA dihydrouridine synthase DusB [Deltaproteobacteria bacterium]
MLKCTKFRQTRVMHIGSLELDNPIILAPMAGITDLPYRLIMKSFGAGLVFTEMISANGLYFNGSTTRELLKTVPAEAPLGVQLFGDQPQRVAEAIKVVEETAQLIDINLGCPVKKVVRSGAGSALMRDPVRIAQLLRAARQATDKPLTIKMRSGWDSENTNYLEIGHIAEQEGVNAVTIHPRTRVQMFGGKADWQHIKDLKQRLSIPVIGSGDIFTAGDVKAIFETSGCDAIMIARGGYGNPWLIRQAIETVFDQPLSSPSPEERFWVAQRHLKLSLEVFGPTKTLGLMRKHLCWYTRGINNAAAFRLKINQSQSIGQMFMLLEEFFINAGR